MIDRETPMQCARKILYLKDAKRIRSYVLAEHGSSPTLSQIEKMVKERYAKPKDTDYDDGDEGDFVVKSIKSPIPKLIDEPKKVDERALRYKDVYCVNKHHVGIIKKIGSDFKVDVLKDRSNRAVKAKALASLVLRSMGLSYRQVASVMKCDHKAIVYHEKIFPGIAKNDNQYADAYNRYVTANKKA